MTDILFSEYDDTCIMMKELVIECNRASHPATREPVRVRREKLGEKTRGRVSPLSSFCSSGLDRGVKRNRGTGQ